MNRKMGVVLILIGFFMLVSVGVEWIFNDSWADPAAAGNVVSVEEGDQAFDTATIKKVVVLNSVGSIRVKGDPNAVQANLHYAKNLTRKWGIGAPELAAERVQVLSSVKGDNQVIEVITADNPFWQGAVSVALDLTLPPNVEVEVQSVAGAINVEQMNAPVRAQNEVGSVNIDGFRESADVKVATGAISIRGGQSIKEVVASSVIGRIDVELPRDAKLRVHAETTTGDITSDFQDLQDKVDLEIPGARVNGKIGDGSAGLIDLSSDTGSIEIRGR